MNSAPVAPGDVLAGKYRVERVLGAGGIGVVVAATHLELDQIVALKFLLPTYVSSAAALERFKREAKAAARLKSEHVARVLDTGTLEDGSPYIVMEYLEGADLSQWLAHSHHLPLPTAVDFVLQACEALAEAHALGIVHRDLKPANLFVTTDTDGTPIVKILDFGIAKTKAGATGSDHALTATSAIVGSPLYMSPEQLESSRDVDHRTDIWALGAILYELTTGDLPFNAPTLPQLCVSVIKHTPRLPSSIIAELPPEFDRVVMHCLEKLPGQRFESVQELSHALMPFAKPEARARVEKIQRVNTMTRLGSSSQSGTTRAPKMLDATMPMDTGSSLETTGPASKAQTTEYLGGTNQSWGASGSRPRPSRLPWVLAAGGVFFLFTLVILFVVRSRLMAAAQDPAANLAAHASASSATATPPASASEAPSVAPTAPSVAPEAEPGPSAAASGEKRSTASPVAGKKGTTGTRAGNSAAWNSRE